MEQQNFNLLLADDDEDDCAFFKEALEELPISARLVTVNNGVKLIDFLLDKQASKLPDILFLDLNMPLKNGFECLTEIKQTNKLNDLPIIVFSTSLDMDTIDLIYKKGALYYICKPDNFSKLKKVIGDAITISSQNNFRQPKRDHFILKP